jgi:arginine exporter protein ArgO
VFSTVRTGEQRVRVIDLKSTELRQDWYNNIIAQGKSAKTPNPALSKAIATVESSKQLMKDPAQAVLFDETELQVYNLLLSNIGTDEDSQKALKALQPRADELSDLITQRENAYNVEVGVSSVKNPLLLNALVLIDAWPLILICSIAFVVGIGLKQEALEVILSSSIQATNDQKQKAARVAATGFIVGDLSPHILHDKPVLIYKRSLLFLPEPFITVCLLVAIVYFTITIPSAEVPSRIMMHSSLLGYHTILLTLAALLLFVLNQTRLYYQRQVINVTGVRVLTPLSQYFQTDCEDRTRTTQKRPVARFLVICVGAVMLLSFCAPWIGNGSATSKIYGYELFLPQKPISGTTVVTFYKVDPLVFKEMRIQVILAVIFGVWAVAFSTWSRREWAAKSGRPLWMFRMLIVGLIVNFSLYLGLLRYWQDREMLWAMLGMILGNGSLTEPRGLPLIIQRPMYGFEIFLVSVIVICLFVPVQPRGRPLFAQKRGGKSGSRSNPGTQPP